MEREKEMYTDINIYIYIYTHTHICSEFSHREKIQLLAIAITQLRVK